VGDPPSPALVYQTLAYVGYNVFSGTLNPTHFTSLPSDRPHRLRSEFSGFLLALVWHTEWSLLPHGVIGDWMIPLQWTRYNAFSRGRKTPKSSLPLGILSPCRSRISTAIGIMHKKFGKDRACGSGHMLADRQTDAQTDTHTDVRNTILRHRSRGRSNKQQ